jgi:hypothetical protein
MLTSIRLGLTSAVNAKCRPSRSITRHEQPLCRAVIAAFSSDWRRSFRASKLWCARELGADCRGTVLLVGHHTAAVGRVIVIPEGDARREAPPHDESEIAPTTQVAFRSTKQILPIRPKLPAEGRNGHACCSSIKPAVSAPSRFSGNAADATVMAADRVAAQLSSE